MVKTNRQLVDLLRELKAFSEMTYQHSINVANIATSFGQTLGLDDKDIVTLRMAALFHDIGKLKIPTEILHKPGRLTAEEYQIMKKHPEYGINLLTSYGLNYKILDVILCHHERIDGLGYPNNLKGEDISDLAKILSICDAYDAMKSTRTYKEEESMEYIRNEFIKNSGTQFDEKYTKLFLEYIDSFKIKNQNKI